MKKAGGHIRLKCCEYNNESKDNSPKTLNDKKIGGAFNKFHEFFFFNGI